MEFNSSPGDLMELSPLFSDDNRVAEAASIAQKLSKMTFIIGNQIITLFSVIRFDFVGLLKDILYAQTSELNLMLSFCEVIWKPEDAVGSQKKKSITLFEIETGLDFRVSQAL